jgi:hypothetical protein
MEPDKLILLYSKYSPQCKIILDMLSVNPLAYINLLCVDNASIRQSITSKIDVKTLPCVLFVYANKNIEKYDGPNIVEWITQEIAKNSIGVGGGMVPQAQAQTSQLQQFVPQQQQVHAQPIQQQQFVPQQQQAHAQAQQQFAPQPQQAHAQAQQQFAPQPQQQQFIPQLPQQAQQQQFVPQQQQQFVPQQQQFVPQLPQQQPIFAQPLQQQPIPAQNYNPYANGNSAYNENQFNKPSDLFIDNEVISASQSVAERAAQMAKDRDNTITTMNPNQNPRLN